MAHDFPHPEENLAKMVNGMSSTRAYIRANIFRFDDPALGRFPVAYLTEPGGWVMNAKEAAGARNDEEQKLLQVLESLQWDISAAAKELGVHRSTVYRRLARRKRKR